LNWRSERIGEGEGVADLVLGSRGKSRINKMPIGSVSQKVIRKSNGPILIVRRNEQSFPPVVAVYGVRFFILSGKTTSFGRGQSELALPEGNKSIGGVME
jgi:hypothetical protein